MSYEFTPRKRDSETTSQENEEIAGFTDELLAKFHSGNRLSSVGVSSHEKAAEVREKLQATTLSDMLLADGESLSFFSPEEYAKHGNEQEHYPDLHLFANTEGTRVFGRVGLIIWGKGWDFDDGSWSRQIDINFAHANKEVRKYAIESISMHAGSHMRVPRLSRGINAPEEYTEMGYEGHGHKSRASTLEDVRIFTATVKRLLRLDQLGDETATTG